MDILLIGNGFDLAHGLPTKYGDFLRFINMVNDINNLNLSISEISENDIFKEYIIKLFDNSKDKIKVELLELSKNNDWLKYFNINETFIKDGWIDFECEILKVIKSLDELKEFIIQEMKKGTKTIYFPKHIQTILQPFYDKDLSSVFFHDLRVITYRSNRLLKYLNSLIRCLEIYFSDYVENIKIKIKSPDLNAISITHLLSFNYTDTYNKIYNSDGSRKIETDFIHGKTNINNSLEENNMVLGIDEYLPIDLQSKNTDFIQFKKFYQRIYKMSSGMYIDWLNDINNPIVDLANPRIHQLYIFGHSLDITDKDVLSELILSKNTYTTIFYHNKQVLGQQITNLVKVIGEKNLIDRVTGKKRTIEFKQQKDMVSPV